MKSLVAFVLVFLFSTSSVAGEECNGWWVFGRYDKDLVRVDQCTNCDGAVGYYVTNMTPRDAMVCLMATLGDGRTSSACSFVAGTEKKWHVCKACGDVDRFGLVSFSYSSKK